MRMNGIGVLSTGGWISLLFLAGTNYFQGFQKEQRRSRAPLVSGFGIYQFQRRHRHIEHGSLIVALGGDGDDAGAAGESNFIAWAFGLRPSARKWHER